MSIKRIYLDVNATAPLCAEAAKAMRQVLDLVGNPSSVHSEGRNARQRVEEARSAVAALAGGLVEGVVFTSGGTEANNLALAQAVPLGASALVIGETEHTSVLAAAAASPLPVHQVRVDDQGCLDPAHLEAALARAGERPFVSVMLANNETGVMAPIAGIADQVHRAGGLLHSDAVQAAGKVSLDICALGVDFLSLSAHKLGGPQGTGALITREPRLYPAIHGGGQEKNRRGGTENVTGIAGFGAAAALGVRAVDGSLQRRFEARLRAKAPDVVIFGADAKRLMNTVCFSAPGLNAETLLIALDLEGFAVSSGAACSSGKVSRSHVLRAMGTDEGLAAGALRVSFDSTTPVQALDGMVDAWARARTRSVRFGTPRALAG